jgi:hypothetical protein
MNLVCKSIFALIAIYVLYSECITLPTIIKKNKKLLYFLIGGLYLYTFDSVEGMSGDIMDYAGPALVVAGLIVMWALVMRYINKNKGKGHTFDEWAREAVGQNL